MCYELTDIIEAEITEKLARIEQMERQLQAHRDKAEQVSALERDFHQLIESGLMKQDAEGNVHVVESWEEHQQIKQMQA